MLYSKFSLYTLIAHYLVLLVFNQQSSAQSFFLILGVVDIDIDYSFIVETGNVIENGMSYNDSFYLVTFKYLFKRASWDRVVLFIVAYQSPIPDGTVVAVKKSCQFGPLLTFMFPHKQSLTHLFVYSWDTEVPFIELFTESGMHVKVLADYLHSVSGGQPFAQFGVCSEQLGISDIQFLSQRMVFGGTISQVVGQY